MYSCDDVIAELSSFIDGEVDEQARRHVESHLRDCRTCTAIYDSTRKSLRIVTDSGSFDVPADMTAKIMERLRSRNRGEPG